MPAVLSTSIDSCSTESDPGATQPHPKKECSREGEPTYAENGNPDVECETEHASGEAAGANEVAGISVRFKGCQSFGLPATGFGLPAGEIQVNPLKGKLGYINKSKHEVGVLLEPATPGLFTAFEIFEGGGEIEVGVGDSTEGSFYENFSTPGVPSGGDGVISPITPINQMTPTFTQTYHVVETT